MIFMIFQGLNEKMQNENNSQDEDYHKNTIKPKKDDQNNNKDLSAALPVLEPNLEKVKNVIEDIELPKEDIKYINYLFPYFKKKIDFGMIIIDTEKYYKIPNLQIIMELHNKAQLNLKNFLFILNKIDKTSNQEDTILKCKAHFINRLDPDIFNLGSSTFISMDSFQLKNELSFKYDFEYYFEYYFKLYYREYVNTTNEKKEEENISFVDFISYEMTKDIKEDREKYLEGLSKKVSPNDYKYIIKIYEKIKDAQNEDINFEIDIDEEESYGIIALKALFVNFKEKIIIPEYSPNVINLLNFFNEFISPKNEKINRQNTRHITEEEKAISEFRTVFEGLKKYENKQEDIIELLSLDLQRLEKIIYNKKRIYIPFIGCSNAGKSTILNCIIGNYIFPESQSECTTRGIILKHSFDGSTSLFETEIDLTCGYYVFKERGFEPLAKGQKNVTEYLMSLNEEKTKNQKKHFYILRTPILLFDILQLSNDLKERISFIDLPGGDTQENLMNQLSNIKDTTICQKLIHISSSFCFVNHGRAINISDNNILPNLFYKSQTYSQIMNKKDFLNNSLFIINEFTLLKDDEKDISKIKDDIIKTLYLNKNNQNIYNINVEIFNAKKYSEYLQIRNSYMNIEHFFDLLFIQFKNQGSKWIKIHQESNFIKFCQSKIKARLKDISFKFDGKKKCDDTKFSEKITSIITKHLQSINKIIEKRDNMMVREIINILFDVRQRINTIKFHEESNCTKFFQQIFLQITNSDVLLQKKYLEYLSESFKFLDKFFDEDFSKKKNIKTEELLQLNSKIEDTLNKIFNNYNFEDLFEENKEKIINFLNKCYLKSSEILKENKNSVNESIKSLSPEIDKFLNEFKESINDKINKLNNEIELLKNKIIEVIKRSIKNVDNKINTQNKNDINYKNISFNFLESLQNNLGQINAAITGGIGGALIIAILGINFVPGVGTALALGAGLLMTIFGFIFSPSKEKKFEKLVKKTNKEIEDKFNEYKHKFIITLEEIKKDLIASFKKEIGISAFKLKDNEQKDFKEKKDLYYKIKKILMK